MANKKMNKNGATITMIVMVLLLVIGIFGGFFLFIGDQFGNYDTVLDEQYNDTYNELLNQQELLGDRVNNVTEAINNAREVESGILAAINGFKGLGQALLLLRDFSSSSFTIFETVIFSNEIIPQNYQDLIIIGLIAFVIFIIIAILKGESKM